MKLRFLSRLLFQHTPGSNAAPAAPRPDKALSWSMLEQARACADQRDFDQAQRVCDKILERDPENDKALMLLSRVYKEQGDLIAAKGTLDKVIGQYPDLAEAYYHRAGLLKAMRRFKGAIRDYRRASAIDPALIAAYLNEGSVQYTIGEFDQALDCARHVLRLEPDHAVARLNQGLMLRELGQTAAAEAALREALELHPDHHETRCSLAMVLIDQGLFDEAEQHLKRVRAAAGPSHVDASWHLSVASLARGRFREGWLNYGSRLQRDDAWKRPYAFPAWDGSQLATGTLLIYAEQGLGDDILFASCFPDVLARVKHCVIECEPRLVELFRRSFPAAVIVGSKSEAHPDWQASTMDITAQTAAGSLPGFFRNEWTDFPDHTGYLVADPVKVEKWRTRLSQLGAGMKVGISWTGGSVKTRRRIRSLALADLLPVLEVPGVHFVSLQYVESADEIAHVSAAHGRRVHHWQEAIDDYDETAALVSALDLVISVCTAVVHLTGALGRPVWVMAPTSPEWRYLRAGERLPWYPAARVFRQQQAQDWGPVVVAVSGELNRIRQA